jgi:lipid II:glycine glycyltransferase (peptidoglycan interpeptide bridge formation enzyme)
VEDLVSRFSQRRDLHQSPMHAQTLRSIGWQAAGPSGSKIYYRSLGPLTLAKLQRPEKLDLSWLKSFRKQHRTFTTYIEPGLLTQLPDSGLGIPVEPFAHSCTSLLNLSLSEPMLLNSFSQKTRYNITRNLKKSAVSLSSVKFANLTASQISNFFALHASWSTQKRVIGHPASLLQAIFTAHQDTGYLHLCYLHDDLVGALCILSYDHVATYYAAFSTPAGYSAFAPTLLTWIAIQTAKSQGCDIFDFGGIYDPRYKQLYKRWLGFTKFKEGFNPTTVSYPKTTLQLFW